MPASDLRSFLAELDAAGELLRVKATVSPILEIAEIADRHSKLPCAVESRTAKRFDPEHHRFGGHALLFEDVEGADFPLAINVFGSYARAERAFGVFESGGLEAIAARIGALTKPEPPASLGAALRKAKEFLPLLKVPPRRVKRGICQEVVKRAADGEVDLTRLPILKCWPHDGDPTKVGYPGWPPERCRTAAGGGRYVTFAGMHTIHADDAGKAKPPSHNVGMYRAQLVDATHLAMHWHMHHDGARHWRSWKRRGERMPIAIVLGGEPVLPYAATAPLPPGISELLMAGFLQGRGIPLVDAATVPLRVPANAEIVIEGWVSTECGPIGFDPATDDDLGPGAVLEGPFGDHTGFYSLPDRYPLVEVTAITHRRDAIYPTTIVGLPPQEDYALGKATERMFGPPLKLLIPDLDDYHLPRYGCFHNAAFVTIEKEYPLQARRVMSSVWGAGQMAWTKTIVVVDHDVDVHDERAVLRALFERCRFDRDLVLIEGPLDILDHAASRLGAGGKLGFDATRKIAGEEVDGVPFDRAPTTRPPTPADVEALASRLVGTAGTVGIAAVDLPPDGLGRLAVVAIEKAAPGDGVRAIEATRAAAAELPLDMVIVIDRPADVADLERVLFLLCANVDPGRDLLRDGERIGFDATSKTPDEARHGRAVRAWPPLLEMDQATKAKVDARWPEY
ncbi:MAG: UbiD family decarboxylase [Planctomycetota bacterium JB042]